MLLLGLLAGPVQGSSIIPPRDLGELAGTSEAVVLARAGTSDAVQRGRLVRTTTPFEVLDVVRGPMTAGASLNVTAFGGATDSLVWAVGGSPRFEEGAVYLLSLHQDARGTWRPRLLSYGLLRRVEGTDGSVLLTHLEGAHDLKVLKRPDGAAVEPIGTYYEADLLRHLRRVATGAIRWDRTDVQAPPSLLPAAVHGSAGKQAQAIPDPCVFLTDRENGQPIRWNVLEDNGPITVYAEASGDADLGGAGPSFVQVGVSQWASIDDITLDWVYGDLRTYEPACAAPDSSAVGSFPDDLAPNDVLVQFNDPCDEIEDLDNGVGVLAFGGPFYSRALHAHQGGDWNTAAIGFVVVNNGIGVSLGPVQYQQVMTHELGHVLGFGHISPLDGEANMNPSCCNSITTIDASCALFAYSNAVTLTAPPDGASIDGGEVTVQWQALDSAVGYRLQVGQDPAFATTTYDEAGLTTTQQTLANLDIGATYYWRVQAAGESGDGPWSIVRSFTTRSALPGTITLTDPRDRSTGQPLTLRLRWQADASADTYQVQVSRRADFGELLVEETGLTETGLDIGPLAESTPHYWRVRGINAAGEGEWSPYRRFTTGALPGAVTLDEPVEAATLPPTLVTLRWQVAADADTYHLQIATDAGFEERAIDERGLTRTVRSHTSLPPDTGFFWRVRGANAFGDGAWSAVRSFATLPAAPEAVTLLAPQDDAGATSGLVTLRWQAADRAETYDVEVATDAGFSTLEVDEVGWTETELDVGPLSYSTIHYWRVRAVNATGGGPWSTPRRFTTAEGTDVERVGEDVPARLALHANYPNPFNARTTVRFDLPEPAEASLVVYDVLGRIVETLTAGPLPAGRYAYVWAAGDLPSGSYLIQLQAGPHTQTRVAMLIR